MESTTSQQSQDTSPENGKIVMIMRMFQNDEEDSEAPTQVQYRWIAKNVTAIQQEVPYVDANDEPVDTNRIEGKVIVLRKGKFLSFVICEELVNKFKDDGLSIKEGL